MSLPFRSVFRAPPSFLDMLCQPMLYRIASPLFIAFFSISNAPTDSDRIAEYDMKLMDIDSDTLGIPDTDYDARVTMPSSEFTRIVRDLSQLGESVRIEVNKEGVRFASDGEAANGSVLLKQTESARELYKDYGVKEEKDDDDDEEEEDEAKEDEEVEAGSKKTKKKKAKKEKVKEEKGEDVDMDEEEKGEEEFKPKSDDEGEDEQDDDDDDDDESGKKRKKSSKVCFLFLLPPWTFSPFSNTPHASIFSPDPPSHVLFKTSCSRCTTQLSSFDTHLFHHLPPSGPSSSLSLNYSSFLRPLLSSLSIVIFLNSLPIRPHPHVCPSSLPSISTPPSLLIPPLPPKQNTSA